MKALDEPLKKILAVLISHEQTAYVKDVSDVLNIYVFLVTMDIEKAFDSLSCIFRLAVLEKFGFGTSFINWIEDSLKKSESCVISSGKTTQYFLLNRGARQGDHICTYLFI